MSVPYHLKARVSDAIDNMLKEGVFSMVPFVLLLMPIMETRPLSLLINPYPNKMT